MALTTVADCLAVSSAGRAVKPVAPSAALRPRAVATTDPLTQGHQGETTLGTRDNSAQAIASIWIDMCGSIIHLSDGWRWLATSSESGGVRGSGSGSHIPGIPGQDMGQGGRPHRPHIWQATSGSSQGPAGAIL